MRVLPSEVAAAIDGLFGPRSHDINDGRVGPQFQADVSTIISLLDQVPNELIDFERPRNAMKVECINLMQLIDAEDWVLD